MPYSAPGGQYQGCKGFVSHPIIVKGSQVVSDERHQEANDPVRVITAKSRSGTWGVGRQEVRM